MGSSPISGTKYNNKTKQIMTREQAKEWMDKAPSVPFLSEEQVEELYAEDPEEPWWNR